MTTTFEITIIGEPDRPAPRILSDGVPLEDGKPATVPFAMAVNLLEPGQAVTPGPVTITPVLKGSKAPGVLVNGRAHFHGDQVEADWSTCRNLIGRGRAKLAEGVTLPRTDPDRPK